LQINRILGTTIILAGMFLMGVVFASANASVEQIDDPIVGYFLKNTVSYLIIATAAVFCGSGIAVFGGSISGLPRRPL
jgi:small-conductance mechanosensitive channel